MLRILLFVEPVGNLPHLIDYKVMIPQTFRRVLIAWLPPCVIQSKLLRFGKNAAYEGETFPSLQCLNSLKRAGIAPGAAL